MILALETVVIITRTIRPAWWVMPAMNISFLWLGVFIGKRS